MMDQILEEISSLSSSKFYLKNVPLAMGVFGKALSQKREQHVQKNHIRCLDVCPKRPAVETRGGFLVEVYRQKFLFESKQAKPKGLSNQRLLIHLFLFI